MRIANFPCLSSPLIIRTPAKRDMLRLYGDGTVIPFYFGRGAIWNAVKMIGASPEDNILMPAYHCSIEVQAVLKAGTNVRFFRVNRDMEPDLKDIEQKIDGHTRALFIIHYFGFPQPIDRIVRVCEAHNLFLIEDAAHAFLSRYNGRYLGTFGHFGILSMKKTLPLPDGGALLINNFEKPFRTDLSRPNRRSLFRMLALMLAKNIEINNRLLYTCVDSLLLEPGKLLLRTLKKASGSDNLGFTSPNSMEYEPNMARLGISPVSLRIMGNLDFEEIIRKRRRNYRFLLDTLKNEKQIEVCFRELPAGVCPCFFTILAKNRPRIEKKLQSRGISTFVVGKSLHRLLPADGFDDARFLSDHVLAIPVHQDLTDGDLRYIAAGLKEAVTPQDIGGPRMLKRRYILA